jgi:transposase
MFEALALTLAREMPVSACARILRCADNTVWRQIDAHVCLARAQESYANVKVIGIDETSCAKGHSYITLVHDLDKARLIHATPGKDASTVQRFTEDLKSHQGQPQAIEVVCMDMSKAFIAGAAQHLPTAAIAFDGFHVVQLANRAVDAVRREEARVGQVNAVLRRALARAIIGRQQRHVGQARRLRHAERIGARAEHHRAGRWPWQSASFWLRRWRRGSPRGSCGCSRSPRRGWHPGEAQMVPEPSSLSIKLLPLVAR